MCHRLGLRRRRRLLCGRTSAHRTYASRPRRGGRPHRCRSRGVNSDLTCAHPCHHSVGAAQGLGFEASGHSMDGFARQVVIRHDLLERLALIHGLEGIGTYRQHHAIGIGRGVDVVSLGQLLVILGRNVVGIDATAVLSLVNLAMRFVFLLIVPIELPFSLSSFQHLNVINLRIVGLCVSNRRERTVPRGISGAGLPSRPRSASSKTSTCGRNALSRSGHSGIWPAATLECATNLRHSTPRWAP